MIRFVQSRVPLRLLCVLAMAVAVALAMTLHGKSSEPAQADPAYGTVTTDPGSQFIIHGHYFTVKNKFTTCTGTGSSCKLGAYQTKLAWDASKASVSMVGSISTGGNTTTTLRDTTQNWKINQWVGSRVTLQGGAGHYGNDGNEQERIVQSNTSNTLTLTAPWDGAPATLPNATTFYSLGGLTNHTWLTSTGRTAICQPAIYTANTADNECITLLSTPPGPTGSGYLSFLTMKADNKGIFTVDIQAPPSRVLRIDGAVINADIVDGVRRIVRCPDADGNNSINVIDLLLVSQANGATPPGPPYNTGKDPDENNTINVIDLLITAGVSGQKCIQP